VDAARILKEERATGLVNAVLRRFVTERARLFGRVDADLSGRTAHPSWLVKRLTENWPEQVNRILDANNAHPPMVLRVDLTRRSREDYVSELRAAGLTAQPLSWTATAVRLDDPIALSELLGFQDGAVSVQDAGAQLAAPLLDARPGMRVLDACAAPGGKTGHLLEHTPDLAELVAVDIDAQRVERIAENLARLKRSARLVAADIRQPTSFWDGRPFDRILLDAPCSSTGVIRRHPDIKLLRRESDIPALAKTQLEILQACFSMLARGGRLLYATCSVLPEENAAVVERFLRVEPDARLVPHIIDPTLASLGGASARTPASTPASTPKPLLSAPTVGSWLQLLPGSEADSDGFYYACLEKTTLGT
jgi:16S rRNA (cytosine967-C5)-methyltransferase